MYLITQVVAGSWDPWVYEENEAFVLTKDRSTLVNTFRPYKCHSKLGLTGAIFL